MAVAEWRVMLVGSHNKQQTVFPICTVTAVFPGEHNGFLVVKVKVSLVELTGPVAYIQQVEANSKSAAKITAVPNRGWVPLLILLIKATRVVTLLGGRRVNLPSQSVLSRLI